tara:strand:+ start:699 stop:875 length:177 start_codon:yes stop_codon:yes gene_type:complete
MTKKKISCWDCKYFAISWDKNFRYECKRLGFKSNYLPSQQVRVIDQRECLAFQAKENK